MTGRTPRTALFALCLSFGLSLALAAAPCVRAQDEETHDPDAESSSDDWPTDRPTSGDMSLFSGRTLGTGESVLAAGVGWPGLWAGLWVAPSSTFNIGFQGHLLYGSPVMGFSTGVGGGLSIPVRIFLWGKKTIDVALLVEPMVVLGEGSLVGENSAFTGRLGMGVLGIAQALVGIAVSEEVTLNLGLGGDFGYVVTFDRGGDPMGGILGQIGIEALMARDFMLFATVRGGIGFARDVGQPTGLFSNQGILHASVGIGYLL